MLRNNRGQWALVEIIVVVAIIVVLASIMLPKYLGGPGKGIKNGGPPTPKERASGVECMSNLNQVRGAINMYQQSNENFPSSLSELSSYGVSNELSICPVMKTPYSYDPAAGRVWCTTGTHEKY